MFFNFLRTTQPFSARGRNTVQLLTVLPKRQAVNRDDTIRILSSLIVERYYITGELNLSKNSFYNMTEIQGLIKLLNSPTRKIKLDSFKALRSLFMSLEFSTLSELSLHILSELHNLSSAELKGILNALASIPDHRVTYLNYYVQRLH